MEYIQHQDPKKFIFISNWEVIHFAISYIAKHSLEKHTGAYVPHYAFIYIIQFWYVHYTLSMHVFVEK